MGRAAGVVIVTAFSKPEVAHAHARGVSTSSTVKHRVDSVLRTVESTIYMTIRLCVVVCVVTPKIKKRTNESYWEQVSAIAFVVRHLSEIEWRKFDARVLGAILLRIAA